MLITPCNHERMQGNTIYHDHGTKSKLIKVTLFFCLQLREGEK